MSKAKIVSIYLDEDFKQWLERLAKKKERTLSGQIVFILKSYFKEALKVQLKEHQAREAGKPEPHEKTNE